MGTGKHFALHETDSTRAATAYHRFDEVIERVKAAGGKITKDESYPLYTDIGLQEGETGEERIAEFNLNRTDFKLIRRTETHHISGQGQHKSLEAFETPRTKITLKKKPELEDDWVNVDLDDMF